MTARTVRGTRVSKRFGGSVALSDVDFELARGEIVGLIGPNGAGKTTLINIVSGNLQPDGGDVHLDGRSLRGLPAHRVAGLGVARTFQLVRPFMAMTVEENVLVGAMFGRTRHAHPHAARAQVEEVLAFLELTPCRTTRVADLNMGERKKVELARALAMDPTVLLLDELVAGMNATETEHLMETVRAINRRGVSLVVVEHVMRVVIGLCTRVMVLHHGRKLADGPTEQVLADRQVVEAYLGRSFVDRFQVAEGRV